MLDRGALPAKQDFVCTAGVVITLQNNFTRQFS